MPTHKSLPAYLQKYVVEQDYSLYQAHEHATWRFIMRQNRAFFRDHAVDIYVDGLEKTGIPIDRIPRITEMDQCLKEFGWGAVGVEGFIPSSVFLDLLARGIMPIACDMRTVDHIGYTPAPDIVHEAAGHAPIVADSRYREFLNRYAQMAYRALISAEDIRLYEAIRYLSDIKENTDATPDEVVRANKKLQIVGQSMSFLSEAGKVARMAWWTTEYGLVGELSSPKIYGAGLLSSIAESQACLSPKVKKIPLTVDCINQTYDITEPQPQLFVAPSLEALPTVLEELEGTFAFKRGGIHGLMEMLRSDTINSILLENDLSVTGRLRHIEKSARFGAELLLLSEDGQICINEQQVDGLGREQFPHGMVLPIGRWQGASETPTTELSDSQLHKLGCIAHQDITICYSHGTRVQGRLKSLHRQGGKLRWLRFQTAVVARGDQVYWHQGQGEFVLVLGERVESVFAGPADRDAYGDYYVGDATTKPGRTSPYTAKEQKKIALFDQLKHLRKSSKTPGEIAIELAALTAHMLENEAMHWLLSLEILEIAAQKTEVAPGETPWLRDLKIQTFEREVKLANGDTKFLEKGLQLIDEPD